MDPGQMLLFCLIDMGKWGASEKVWGRKGVGTLRRMFNDGDRFLYTCVYYNDILNLMGKTLC